MSETPPTAPIAATAHRLAGRAFAWLGEHHTLGALPADITISMTDPDHDYKPLGETALVASLALREGVTGPREAETARRLLDFAWEQLREGDLLYERQLRHPHMTDPLELYAHLARAGYRHPRLERLLAHLRPLRTAQAAEVMPNRRLAVANAARIVGLPARRGLPAHQAHRGHDDRDWRALADATWLGGTPEPWAVDWFTAYCVTHTVFHLTDWGAIRDGLPEPLQEYLRLWLPVWVEAWTEVGQWDLICELLIVDACLDEPVCGPEPWQRLAAVQHDDGLMPHDDRPLPEDPAEIFLAHHHPTVVAAIAGTLALSRALGSTR
ncbi:DUF6895 family protein [Streptomyces sp. 6N223]|uniref:DUF6895 family protein n=1 Tax=Streptomyces sp. 6N223 TaxID=3457412 RepID=UPI003FD59A5D